MAGLRLAPNRRAGFLVGWVYGVGFFGGLMWWLSELGSIAVIPLVVVQAAFIAGYAFWLSGYTDRTPLVWSLLATGGWALMELLRYHFPVNGLEWGAAGYALSDGAWSRSPAVLIGTTGLTVLVAWLAATLALFMTKGLTKELLVGPVVAVAIVALGTVLVPSGGMEEQGPVVVVQGSTPCPFEHCQPNERLRTFEQHLELTEAIDEAWLVVWAEGSTGSFNADPVQNPEIGALIGEQARRLDAWFIVGSDRPISDTEWINANVVFNPDGEIIGEYRKQHPVPFGEYIPARPLFEWIPALDQVPRDMIPGDGPVVFDLDGFPLGSVISFEGGFSRYPRQHVREGASLIVVATNEASYGTTPASDQFIGMTRMRAVELGVPVVHSAVTGKSVFIDAGGGLSQSTGLGTMETLSAIVETTDGTTPYTRTGDFVLWAAAAMGVVMWWRNRRLVGSAAVESPKEDSS